MGERDVDGCPLRLPNGSRVSSRTLAASFPGWKLSTATVHPVRLVCKTPRDGHAANTAIKERLIVQYAGGWRQRFLFWHSSLRNECSRNDSIRGLLFYDVQ